MEYVLKISLRLKMFKVSAVYLEPAWELNNYFTLFDMGFS